MQALICRPNETIVQVQAQWYKLIRTNLPDSLFYSNADTFAWSSWKAQLKGSFGDGCRVGGEWEHAHTYQKSLIQPPLVFSGCLDSTSKHLPLTCTFPTGLCLKSIKLIHPKVITSMERGTLGKQDRKREKEIRKERETIHFCEWLWRKLLAVFLALTDRWPTMSLHLHAFYSNVDTSFCQILTPRTFNTHLLFNSAGFIVNFPRINISLK